MTRSLRRTALYFVEAANVQAGAAPASADTSVTPVSLRLSVCMLEQPASADTSVTSVPSRLSMCRLEQPASADTSVTPVL